MKKAKKIASLILALVMVLAVTTTAFAQDVEVGTDDGGSIMISNAAKGETYTIYKLFDASVTGTTDGSIAYTGDIPSSLAAYFEKDVVGTGNISTTAAAWKDADKTEMSDGLREALATWVETATAAKTAVSDGSTLTFTKVPYGYYVVTTTQGDTAISVDSTNPTVTIVDKNSTNPVKNLTKSVDNDNVNIGDTVTYTVSFATANYAGAGTGAKKIISYTIDDTLPEFLSNVTVTSIIVDNDADSTTTNDQKSITAQFDNKKIVLDWYDEANSKFFYDNGAVVTITYTAVVTEKVAIDGNGNTNTVTVSWIKDGNEGPAADDKMSASATIFSYAIALKKVNDKGDALADAEFQFPFYVKKATDSNGAYIYAGTYTADEYAALTEDAKAAITNTITTPASGEIVVKGVASGDYSITEVTAPDGYNKLLSPVPVKATKTSKTSTDTTFYLAENGQVVAEATDKTVEVKYTNGNLAATAVLIVNMTGTELPSTGGIGTTIFYVVGGILVLGAGVVLVAKKRMNHEA